MKNIIILLTVILAFSLTTKAQGIYDKETKFMQLVLKNPNLESQLNNINTQIFSKSNGSEYPLCKMIFSKDEKGMYNIEVEAIDNGWGNLFRPDQITYGYVIVDNRMFWVMANNNSNIDLNELFYGSEVVRSFNTKPTLSNKMTAPIWVICQNSNDNDQFYVQNVRNLDLLGK